MQQPDLLNFRLPERARPPPNRQSGRKPPPARRQPANRRARFLRANYLFVVENDVQYSAWLTDPDAEIDWASVEQVLVTGDAQVCPICLSPPYAARLTPCGHLYCWTCILQCFAHLGTARSCPCPMCFEDVVQADLRPVRSLVQRPLVSGDVLPMILMMRHRGASVAVPRSLWDPRLLLCAPDHVPDSLLARFCKLQCATPASTREQIVRDAVELSVQFAELAPDDAQTPFVGMALAQLQDQARLKRLPEVAAHLGSFRTIPRLVSAARPSSGPTFSGASAQLADAIQRRHASAASDDRADYFYQAADGRPIFLHPLFLRLIANHHGGYANLPGTCDCLVAEVEEMAQSEDVRSRHRAFSHLSLNTTLTLCGMPNSALPAEATRAPELRQYRQRAARAGLERVSRAPSTSRDMNVVENGAAALVIADPEPKLSFEADFPSVLASSSASSSPPSSSSSSSPPSSSSKPVSSYARMASRDEERTLAAAARASAAPSAADFPPLGEPKPTPTAPTRGAWNAQRPPMTRVPGPPSSPQPHLSQPQQQRPGAHQQRPRVDAWPALGRHASSR